MFAVTIQRGMRIALYGFPVVPDVHCAVLEDGVLTILQDRDITRLRVQDGAVLGTAELDIYGMGYAIYATPRGYILRGEEDVALFDQAFRKQRGVCGADIFMSLTQGNTFTLHKDRISVHDWDNNYYEFDLDGNAICFISSAKETIPMLKTLELYSFSPTGGTKKTAMYLAEALAETVIVHELCDRNTPVVSPEADVVLVAAPVFGGRIPPLAAEKLRAIQGQGKEAVTLAVYGTRAYEDALLEINDILTENGFTVIASGAFVAQHSVVPIVGAGRPDDRDAAELQAFGKKILDKLAGAADAVTVPGNRPYKAGFTAPAAPLSQPSCVLCGKCARICPAGAITIADGVLTTSDNCFLCVACVRGCLVGARILPPPLQAAMDGKLGALKDVRRENEIYL